MMYKETRVKLLFTLLSLHHTRHWDGLNHRNFQCTQTRKIFVAHTKYTQHSTLSLKIFLHYEVHEHVKKVIENVID